MRRARCQCHFPCASGQFQIGESVFSGKPREVGGLVDRWNCAEEYGHDTVSLRHQTFAFFVLFWSDFNFQIQSNHVNCCFFFISFTIIS